MSRGALLLILAAAALVAVGCDHVVRQTGGALVSIAPICEDTGRPPKEFVLEIAFWQTDWATAGGGRSHVETWRELNLHVASLRATIENERAEYYVSVYICQEGRRLPWQDGVHEAQDRYRWIEVVVYCDGYKMATVEARPLLDEKVKSRLATLRLKRSNASTEDFWYRLGHPIISEPYMAAWEKASRDSEQRAAIERVYRWYIARYDAAVRDKPELLKDADAARYMARLRERLAKLTAKNSNTGK